jgi:hypothetical protein
MLLKAKAFLHSSPGTIVYRLANNFMESAAMASKAIDNKSSRINRGLESTPADQLKSLTTNGIRSYGCPCGSIQKLNNDYN